MFPTSVDQAIAKGRKSIHLPCLMMMILPATITYLVTSHPYAVMLAPMILLAGTAFAAIYRARAVPRWMVWAFSNVRNVHELKRRAAFAWLIPSSENVGLRKFERWTARQREQWAQLEKRFDEPDLFIDDVAVSAQTMVYFAWYKKMFLALLSLVTAGYGVVCLLFLSGELAVLQIVWRGFMGIFFVVLGGFLMYRSVKQLLNTKAQIVMNDNGLETAGHGFSQWTQIKQLNIVPSGKGRYRTFYLQYWGEGRFINFELDGMDMGRRKLDRLIRIYQGRSRQASLRGTER